MNPDPEMDDQLARDERLADLAANDPVTMGMAEEERAQAEADSLVWFAATYPKPTGEPLPADVVARFEKGRRLNHG